MRTINSTFIHETVVLRQNTNTTIIVIISTEGKGNQPLSEQKLSDCDCATEKDVNAGGAASSSAAGWTNWAVSGMTSLTSKIYKGNRQAQQRPTKVSVTATDAVKEGWFFRVMYYLLLIFCAMLSFGFH